MSNSLFVLLFVDNLISSAYQYSRFCCIFEILNCKLNMKTFILTIFFIILSLQVFSQDTYAVCIDNTEKELFSLINKYRHKNKLNELEFSASLCYVADVHAKDLFINEPYKKCGSFNSWSNKGRWKELCYDKSKYAIKAMKAKPAELTNYMGQSVEIVYYSNKDFNANDIFDTWLKSDTFKNIILNKPPNATSKWVSIGIAVFENFACVWFGPTKDNSGNVIFCDKLEKETQSDAKNSSYVSDNKADDNIRDSIITEHDTINIAQEVVNQDIITSTDSIVNADSMPAERDTWYVIVAVATTSEKAEQMVTNLKNRGYEEALYILKDKKIRVAIKSFYNFAEADQYKTQLRKKEFKDAWVLKK